MSEAAEVHSGAAWPDWMPPADPTRVGEDGYGHVAQFVLTKLLESRYYREFPIDLSESLAATELGRRERDRRAVELLWERLVAQSVRYVSPPFSTGRGQRIRHPMAILGSNGYGTCIDLTLLFAGVCANAGLAVSLLLVSDGRNGHSAVCVHLGKEPERWEELGARADGAPGVYRVERLADLLNSDRTLLIDPTTASDGSPDRSLAFSTADLIDHLTEEPYDYLHLVNVRQRREDGDEHELQNIPEHIGVLQERIELEAVHFPFHNDALTRLRAAKGVVVVGGPSGSGKSTLARRAAVSFDQGYGWVIDGTSPATTAASLVEHELRERRVDSGSVEKAVQGDLLPEARQRLSDPSSRWVVVLDNADAGPSGVIDLLPIPAGEYQLIIVTTTRSDLWTTYQVLPDLKPLADEDIGKAAIEFGLPAEHMTKVAAGSPLLLKAFAKLMHAHPSEMAAVRSASTLASIEEGAALHWQLVGRVAPSAVETAHLLALLPPDRLEVAVVDGFEGTEDLSRCGVLTSLSESTLSLHRMYGGAIREAMNPDEVCRSAETVLAARPVVELITKHADSEVITRLEHAMTTSQSGRALHGLATVLEMTNDKKSVDTFERAEPLLSPEDAELLADCLHGKARRVNKDGDATEAEIAEAIDWAKQSVALRPESDAIGRAKGQAMIGNLLRKSVHHLLPGDPERIKTLNASMAILDESYETRKELLGEGHYLVDRALFNLAGPSIRLAQDEYQRAGEDRSAVKEHLDRAEGVYRATERFRRDFYASRNLTAASVAGVATVLYYKALYELEDVDLVAALKTSHEALEWRSDLRNAGDVRKSSAITGKLAVLQYLRANGQATAWLKDSGRELWPDFEVRQKEVPPD